jgi:hypothetical protein
MNEEKGQVMLLTLGLTIVCFAIAGLAVDGTRVFLLRRSLQNVADAAALAGASEIDANGYYGSGGRSVRLDPERAKHQAEVALVARGLPVTAAVSVESGGVEVAVSQPLATTFLALVGIRQIPVRAEARAAPAAGP